MIKAQVPTSSRRFKLLVAVTIRCISLPARSVGYYHVTIAQQDSRFVDDCGAIEHMDVIPSQISQSLRRTTENQLASKATTIPVCMHKTEGTTLVLLGSRLTRHTMCSTKGVGGVLCLARILSFQSPMAAI